MNLVSPDGASSVEWVRGSLAIGSRQTMTWYKVENLKGQGNGKGMNRGIFIVFFGELEGITWDL